jgi:exonuclease I
MLLDNHLTQYQESLLPKALVHIICCRLANLLFHYAAKQHKYRLLNAETQFP